MAKFLTLDDVEVKDKVVLVRVDFNSPIDPETKKILDDSRIRAHGESTIKELSEKGARLSFWRIKDARVIQILYP